MREAQSNRHRTFRYASPVLVAAAVVAVVWVGAGDLNPPPGAIQPTNRVQLNEQVITLPYTIAQAGSYMLTSNLTASGIVDGIIIDADNVTLDLNGFALLGGPGSLDGVRVNGPRRRTTVKNGTITGWDGNGIDAGSAGNGRFEDLSIGSNNGDGIRVGSDGIVRGLSVAASSNAGIRVSGARNRIEANHVTQNGTGIAVDGTDNLIVKNSADGNGLDYDIAAGNAYGPIVNVAGVGDISVVPNADHPWANFALTCNPTTEVCDGVDNDCDTLVDEDFPSLGQACSVGVGECQASGTVVCTGDGSGTECDAVPGTPTSEICDGLDNDCDGANDEGNPGGGAPCNTGLLGVCAAGTMWCDSPSGQLLCQQDTPPSPEICDGLDNDCDGVSDEGNPGCGAGELCCGGACADVMSDPNNCGSCGNVCAGGAMCVSGICQASCVDGMQNGDETDVDCGGSCPPCGNGSGCIAPGDCVGGGCCGGICVDMSSDPNNCGTCGSVCPGGGSCNAGVCTAPNGTPCTNGSQCASSWCFDGVCCNAPCLATCLSCNLLGSEGMCTLIPAGLDPDNECPGASTCDGAGGCCLDTGAGCSTNSECCSDNCLFGMCQ